MPSLMDVTLGNAVEPTAPASLRARCASSRSACVINSGVAPFQVAAVNSSWTWLCGYSESEAIGKAPAALLQGTGTDQAKAAAFTAKLHDKSTARVTLVNYSRLGLPFVHKIRATKVADGDKTWFVTESEVEEDPDIANAVLRSSGVSLVLAEAFGFGLSWLVALGLVLLTFVAMNALATSALRSQAEQPLTYDGYFIQDPYFFSFDHGLPFI